MFYEIEIKIYNNYVFSLAITTITQLSFLILNNMIHVRQILSNNYVIIEFKLIISELVDHVDPII